MKKVTEEKDIFDKIVDVGAIIGAIIFILSVIYAIIESNAEPEYDFSHLRRSSYGYGNSSSSIQALSKHHHIMRPQNRINHQTAKTQRVTLIMQRIIQTRKTFMTTIMMTFLIIMTQKTTITDINS